MQERHPASWQREQGRAFARKSFIQADSLRVLIMKLFPLYFYLYLIFVMFLHKEYMYTYIYSIVPIQEC